jgi:lipoyl(octanoyl) transferase
MMVRDLGQVELLPTFAAMQSFTEQRESDTPDELWICEHPPVFTQGLAGKANHVLDARHIPVVQTNRGGQVTYHGPGQVVAYPLLDLKRAGYFVKEYVYRLEDALLRTLAAFGVIGHRVAGAPGIYVRLDDPHSHAQLPQRPQFQKSEPSVSASSEQISPKPCLSPSQAPQTPNLTGLGKIAALGIKVSRNCTYHGLALNVCMDLSPFSNINPCGYAGLHTVDLSTMGITAELEQVKQVLSQKLVSHLLP